MTDIGCTILPFAPKQSLAETPVELAWREYQSLVQRQIDNPELAGNLDHCMAAMRAFKKWGDLFIAEDAA